MGISAAVQMECTQGAKLEFQIGRRSDGRQVDLTDATVRVAFAAGIGQPTLLSGSTDDGRIVIADGDAAVTLPAFATQDLPVGATLIGMVWITYPGQEAIGPERPAQLRLTVQGRVY